MMKRTKLLWIALFLALLLTCGSVFTAFAEESGEATPTEEPVYDLWIWGHNLAMEDSIYIYYGVPVEGTNGKDVKMLIWTEPQESYTYGTQTYELSPEPGTMNAGSTQLYLFNFDKLAAKHMTVDVYARAYVEDENGAHYSEVDKYSVLQYCYNMLGKTSSAVPTPELEELLNALLDYGAAAQKFFIKPAPDRLANDEYYQITLNGALLPDGYYTGLYENGEKIEVTAPDKNTEGKDFLYWENSAEEQVSEELTYTIEVNGKNETYTAVYGDKGPVATDASYFTFTELADGTYSIAAKDVNNMPATLVIPSTYLGKAVTVITESAFYNCSNIKSITIPDSVTSIKYGAFASCSDLTSVIISNNVTSIEHAVFSNCSSLTSITIPDGVVSIDANAFKGCTSLTGITIPDSVTNIGDSAFKDCYGLTSITIPNGVTIIGKYMFYGCSGLTSIAIPDGLTSIGECSFEGCSSLISISIPDSVTSIGNRAFFDCTSLTNITISDSITVIGNCIFTNCASLTNISIPDGVTSIGFSAFSGCNNLACIAIPNSVTSIGQDAFFDCVSLTSVYYSGTAEDWLMISIGQANSLLTSATIYYYSETKPTTAGNYWHYVDGVPTVWEPIAPEDLYFTFTELSDGSYSVKAKDPNNMPAATVIPSTYKGKRVSTVEDGAFANCKNMVSITIPLNINTIGTKIFEGCSKLTTVYYNTTYADINNPFLSVESIKNVIFGSAYVPLYAAYNNTNIKNVTVLSNVQYIDSYAFQGCTNLETVTIENGVHRIMACSFYGCKTLKNVTIPSSIIFIGNTAFRDCSSLSSITLPANLTSLGGEVFWNCTSLTSISIPGNIKQIPYGLFYGCKNLQSVSYSNQITSIDSYAFNGCSSLTSLTIPKTVKTMGAWIFNGCTNLKSVYISDMEAWCKITYSSIDGNPLFNGANLYLNNTLVTEVVIPDTITKLSTTFAGCQSLTKITIPNTVTSITEGAFYNCSGLTAVTIPESVTNIGNSVFAGCEKLVSVTLPTFVNTFGSNVFYNCKSLTNVTIPNGVSSIESYTFTNCSALESIVLPDSVTNIAWNGFYGCTNLNAVYYAGTIDTWSTITVGSDNDPLTSATIYYYSESQPTDTKNQYWYYVEDVPTVWVPYVGTDASYFNFTELSDGTYSISVKKKSTLPSTVVIPENYNGKAVTKIASYAFSECSNLTAITIPKTITCIGSNAFYDCSYLNKVTFKNTSGWVLSDGTTIPSSYLYNPGDAATWVFEYFYYTWNRT